MTREALREEMRAAMRAALKLVESGGLKIALCHIHARARHEIIGVQIPDPRMPHARDLIRAMICARVAAGGVEAVVFVAETWMAACPAEESALVDQWLKDHGNSLEGSPWTRDTLTVWGACAEGEAPVLTVTFDERRRPGEPMERTGGRSRYTSDLPWPGKVAAGGRR
jgi:hypothetical protein